MKKGEWVSGSGNFLIGGSVAFVMLSSLSVWIYKVFVHNIIRKRTEFYCFHVSQRKNLFLEELSGFFS